MYCFIFYLTKYYYYFNDVGLASRIWIWKAMRMNDDQQSRLLANLEAIFSLKAEKFVPIGRNEQIDTSLFNDPH